ncbi:hypothetical protein AAVH_10793 [Aphelenchoides avenae]|nr:hypothetical protein AAVH_10793 [Aphelenchus avenae]
MYPWRFLLEIVSSEQGLDPAFKPFLDQPFDGLLYIYGYPMMATMYLPKESVISYGSVNASRRAPVQIYGPQSSECVVPYVNIDDVKFGLEGSDEMSYGFDFLHGFIVPIPEIVLPETLFDYVTSDPNLTLAKNGHYIIGCKINFETRLVIEVVGTPKTSYTIPMVYLVDQVEQDVCVLRMRPLDPGTDNYCSTLCGNPTERSVGLYNLLNEGDDEGKYERP